MSTASACNRSAGAVAIGGGWTETGGDFLHRPVSDGVRLYLQPTDRFKSTRVDVFVPTLLRRPDHTRLALLGRLLERGTRALPDLRRLNRFLDRMYGASFAVDVESFGDRQVLHLSLEVVDDRFLLEPEPLLAQALRFVTQVLRHPVRQGQGFPSDYLRQEKQSLRQYVAGLANDRSAYAQRRCVEIMCAGEPYGLAAHGDPRDFRGIDAVRLMAFHERLLAERPIDLFLSGCPDRGALVEAVASLFSWPRQTGGLPTELRLSPAPRTVRRAVETEAVNQGRLVLGYRTRAHLLEDYAALLLFNAVWGGDSHSRLFRQVRERAGLCYHVGTHLEPMCGLLFVEAGVERRDVHRACGEVARQLDVVREGRIRRDELEAARRVLLQRLRGMDDQRDGVLRFHYHHRLAGLSLSRRGLARQLAEVEKEDLARVGQGVVLDTVYYLRPGPAGKVACEP